VGKGQTVRASLGSGHDQAVPEGTPAVPAATRWVRVNRGEGGRLEVASYYGPDLRPGHEVVGPALIDDLDTTVWIPVRARARIDGRGTLTMELEP
jgi:N-methylhydantoinase A